MRKIQLLLSTLVLLMVAALPVNAVSWTVAGTSAALNGSDNWSVTNTDNDMTSGDGTNYTLTVTDCTLETGTTYQFKVVKNHAWGEEYPSSNKEFTVDETAVYTVEYSFNADSKAVGVTTTKTGEAGAIVHTYTIAGDEKLMGNDWNTTDASHDMITNDDTNYTLTLSNKYLATGTYYYKVVQDHAWGVSFPAQNAQINVSHNGYYNVVFTFNANSKAVNATVTPVPYIVDFNTAITTSDHAFQVASNWGHIVDYLEYDNYGPEYSYVTYGYVTDGGKDNTGALRAYSQHLTASYSSESKDAYDLLVTPLISGTINIDVKAMDYSDASLEIYALTNNGTEKGDLIKSVTYSELSTSDYTTISFNLASEQRIGIRMNRVYIDNFAAESVTIIPEPKLTITKVTKATNDNTVYFQQQDDGSLLVQMYVTLKNQGEVDFVAGATENYTLSVIQDYYGTKYGPFGAFDIPIDLAKGETSEPFLVEVNVPAESYSTLRSWGNWYVIENVTSTQSAEYVYAGLTAYEPKFVFRKAGSSSTSNISSAEAWGTITESTTKNYEIANTGTAPLIVNSIQIPEGFTTDATGTDVVLFRTSGYNADGAVWYAWTWNDGEEGTWVAEAEGKFTGLRQKVNFIRMNPTGAPNWDNEWNRTGDLTVEPGKTYVIDSWGDTYEGKNYVNGHWAAAVVAKGETKAINITNDASVAGTFVGDLVIKHLDKDAVEQTYTLGFSTTIIGLNTWTADFNNTTSTVVYPEGSVAEGGIDKDSQFISSGNYNNWLIGRSTSSSYATENNKFITPKLHATAGEKLAFDVKAGYSSTDAYFVKVYVSTDRKTWGEPVETYVYSNTGSSFTTKTITFAEEGDYYVAFALYGSGSGIDNLVGLEKVTVAHDLYIKSVNWPDASIKSGTAQTKPTVSVIPLTTEAAGNYTVKYIYGENEVAIASKDLTASAKNSTDFSASFTPVVASTTTFPGTKVVFDFGGGVTFETETFDLTVTNEPKFHFLNSKHTSRWYEPSSDYTTPYNFGKTNSNDSKTFWILNWGSAPLTVKSITVPEGFTASVASMNLPAFDGTNEGLETCQQSFDITFTATEPGTYGGDMVITYVDGNGDDKTFELAVSGTKLDPAKWYTNFNDQQWPAGSVYQDNVSISYINTGNYGLMSSSDTNNIFITPKLTAAAGDVLQFDASTRNNYYDGTVKVYISNNRENLGDPVKEIELSKSENVSMSTYEYQFAAAGEYYVAFALEEARVDNIYGLTPVAIAHDWMIASSNIPTEAMQNVAKNASVNLLNLGLADEAADSYEVNLYIGGEKAATAATTPALPMDHQLSAAGTQITVPMKSPKAGTFPVYIEVKAGEYSVATEPVSVTFAEEAPNTGGIQVGTKTGTTYNSSNSTIVDWYYADGSGTAYTDVVYSAAKLAAAGIKAGDKITTISFKHTNSAKSFKAKVTSWVALSTSESFNAGAPNKDSMQEIAVYDGSTIDFPANFEMALNLTTPIVYDGTSDIRIYTETVQQGTGNYLSVTTDVDEDIAIYYNSTATTRKAPLAYITLAVEPKTYSGTVNDDSGNAIENATVTLVSTDEDNIQYTGTTNAAGEFSINVIQTARTYNATVSAYGYGDATDADITFADNVAKDFELIPASEVSVTVTAAGWATITTPATYAVKFNESTEVYIATSENGESITLEKISDAPAMTPVVINATAGSYTMTKIAKATSNVEDNILQSSDGTITGDYNSDTKESTYYVLGMNSSNVVGFGPLADGVTLAKGKAYLVPTSGSGFLTFVIGDEDETTSINSIDNGELGIDNSDYYNLSGQKVGKDYKGVVIVNGKKVIRK